MWAIAKGKTVCSQNNSVVIVVIFINWVWRFMHVVLARGRLKQEDHYEFEASLDCILRFRLMKKKTRRKRKEKKEEEE